MSQTWRPRDRRADRDRGRARGGHQRRRVDRPDARPNTGVPVGFNTVIALLALALLAGLVAYAVVEYAQTGRLDSLASQFDTRTIVLIPIAIAINIILGQTVAAALKVPIYLDSIGTILVAVLAGPLAGAVTGG